MQLSYLIQYLRVELNVKLRDSPLLLHSKVTEIHARYCYALIVLLGTSRFLKSVICEPVPKL